MEQYIEKAQLSTGEHWRELYRERSKYQSIQVFVSDKGTRLLFVNGAPRVHGGDVHRYAECLSVIPYVHTQFAKHVLILGGGDGLSAEALLKFPLRTVTVVDFDKKLMEAGRTYFDTYQDKRIEFVASSPRDYIRKADKKNLLILLDFPDGVHPHYAEFYSVEFLKEVKDRLVQSGVVVISLPCPFYNPRAFGCILETFNLVFSPYNIVYYKVFLPFMGRQRGFVMACPSGVQIQMPADLLYLNNINVMSHFLFGNDEIVRGEEPSTQKNNNYILLLLTPFTRSTREETIDQENNGQLSGVQRQANAAVSGVSC